MTTAMPSNVPPQRSFAYTAQTFEGQPLTGTIDAIDFEDASRRLSGMRIRLMNLEVEHKPPRSRPLTGEDFASFNQQLAHLSSAGLPIELGLRLIAEDLRSGALAQSVRAVTAELERGVPLGEAFNRHQSKFPPLYGAIVDAGVRAGNLPEVLLNLGRHLELIARLRAALWRAAAYPLMVMAGLLIVLIFVANYIIPEFQKMYDGLRIELPLISKFVFTLGRAAPVIAVIGLVLFVGLPLLSLFLRAMGLGQAAADMAMHVPLAGPILRRNLVARWCDAMRVGVLGGMDLPAAIQLAGDVVRSPALRRDGKRMVEQVNSGMPIDSMNRKLSVLPLPVLVVVQAAIERNDLPAALQTLSRMYEQQAELRTNSIQIILTPVLMMLVAIVIAVVILGLFAPIASLLRIF